MKTGDRALSEGAYFRALSHQKDEAVRPGRFSSSSGIPQRRHLAAAASKEMWGGASRATGRDAPPGRRKAIHYSGIYTANLKSRMLFILGVGVPSMRMTRELVTTDKYLELKKVQEVFLQQGWISYCHNAGSVIHHEYAFGNVVLDNVIPKCSIECRVQVNSMHTYDLLTLNVRNVC